MRSPVTIHLLSPLPVKNTRSKRYRRWGLHKGKAAELCCTGAMSLHFRKMNFHAAPPPGHALLSHSELAVRARAWHLYEFYTRFKLEHTIEHCYLSHLSHAPTGKSQFYFKVSVSKCYVYLT